MRKHAVLVCSFLLAQITECEQVEALVTATASRVDWEEDWPGKDATKEGDGRADADEAQEEVCIKRLMLKSVGVWDLPESAEPVEEASWESWGSLSVMILAFAPQFDVLSDLLLAQGPKVRSWSVKATLRAAQNQKNGEVDEGDQQSWNESGNEARKRRIHVLCRFLIRLRLTVLRRFWIKLPLDEG